MHLFISTMNEGGIYQNKCYQLSPVSEVSLKIAVKEFLHHVCQQTVFRHTDVVDPLLEDYVESLRPRCVHAVEGVVHLVHYHRNVHIVIHRRREGRMGILSEKLSVIKLHNFD